MGSVHQVDENITNIHLVDLMNRDGLEAQGAYLWRLPESENKDRKEILLTVYLKSGKKIEKHLYYH